ncbi:MAG: DUF1294 domain-containing protein [Ruminococcus sp.]|nr:DUF1294 domain-containing protein [Ruminococcus sp.]
MELTAVLLAAGAYLMVISIVGFILPPIDKSRAKRGVWRIPEKTLFIVSLLGGAVAMYISMRIFRHKTLHKRFMIGIPLIIVLHIALIVTAFVLLR